MQVYTNYPIRECVDTVAPLIEKGGVTVFQKWSCASCMSRQTMSVPNKFFTFGTCEECGHVTDITREGCNYLLIASTN